LAAFLPAFLADFFAEDFFESFFVFFGLLWRRLFRDFPGCLLDLFVGRLGSFLGRAGGVAHRVRHLFQNGVWRV
jgi:hypothetical protein